MRDNRDPVLYEETAVLLDDDERSNASIHSNASVVKAPGFVPEFALPIALLSALAMASTAATAYFAYATLLCKDPNHCEDGETSRYAGFVAGATCVSNILGTSTLGYLQKKAVTHRKLGLLLWMLCRSMSAVMLLVGVSVNNIYTALSSRVFEGLASDNLLHFILNAIYAQSESKDKTSSLISYSLALYMIGISVSPFIAGLFGKFTISFFIAIGLFVFILAYIQIGLVGYTASGKQTHEEDEINRNERQADHGFLGRLRAWSNTIFSPLVPFRGRPAHICIGLSLFCYNIIQSYVFNALLIYTSTRFGFTGKENGFIISIAHSVAALYIFMSLFLIPWMMQFLGGRGLLQPSRTRSGAQNRDILLAVTSLAIQSLSIVALGFANQPGQVYLITVLLAIGLPVPSFIKAYFVGFFQGKEKPTALAALSMMEMLGSVLGPLVLGGLQSYFAATGGIFFVAAGIGGISLIFLTVGSMIVNQNTTGYISS
ncbi:major facilitator superfamily domain-containing protein [Hypoxylon cercidicola]|nr:major facilitator superfamily domain-containing protein [Hypoxylon cercidicola]